MYTDLFDLMRENELSLEKQVLTIMQAGLTKRFHTTVTLKENTTAEHQWGVAMFCWLLSEGKPSANLLMSALTHDSAEKVFGDIPAPAKRLMGMRETLNVTETDWLRSNDMLFDLTIDEVMVLKIADIADAMLFCIRERKMGNTFVEIVFRRLTSYLINETSCYEHQQRVMRIIRDLWEETCRTK